MTRSDQCLGKHTGVGLHKEAREDTVVIPVAGTRWVVVEMGQSGQIQGQYWRQQYQDSQWPGRN